MTTIPSSFSLRTRLFYSFLKQFIRGTFYPITEKITFSVNEQKFHDLLKANYSFSNILQNKILVEGGMANSGPNYLFRLVVLMDKLCRELNLTPMIAFNGYGNHHQKEIATFKHLGIRQFIRAKSGFTAFKIFCTIYCKSFYYYYFISSKEILLKDFEYKNIYLGDLIIDSYIKARGSDPLTKYVNPYLFGYLCQSIFLVEHYYRLFEKAKIKLTLVTHTQYNDFGVLARVAFRFKCPVIETTDMALLISKPNTGRLKYPTYHGSLRDLVYNSMKESQFTRLQLQQIRDNLDQRISGKFKQYDLTAAYGNKKIYTEMDLKTKLKIRNDNPFVFVFAHVFSDAPLSIGEHMLYIDYHEWLVATIELALKNDKVNWIIKPHPSSPLYKEKGLVKNMVSNLECNHVYLCPEDMSPASVRNLAKAIVTARGTVGIEYAPYGIPVIIAGDTFYSNFGFTIQPETVKEYSDTLTKIEEIEPLNNSQMRDALIVYGIFNKYSGLSEDKIISPEIFDYVWGINGHQIDKDKAFQSINNNILSHGIDKWGHFKLVDQLKDLLLY